MEQEGVPVEKRLLAEVPSGRVFRPERTRMLRNMDPRGGGAGRGGMCPDVKLSQLGRCPRVAGGVDRPGC